ncbi:vacuole protein [Coprinopsis sp. MPI-PUGE-AT-0042]|nr:vacuole protein [Coprinopsis sp. MPI-PUGE-AT-0042]
MATFSCPPSPSRVHRILQPRSYGAYAPSTSFSSHRLGSLNTHSQDGIRQTTMELAQALSGSLVSSSLASGTIGVAGPSSSTAGVISGGIGGRPGNSRDLGQASGSGGFIFPTSPILESSETGDLPTMGEEGEEGGDRSRPSSELDASLSSLTDFDLESKESLVDAGQDGEISFGKGKKKKEKRKKPSGLSLLRPIGSRSYSSSSSSSTASSRSKERQDVPAITIATSPSTNSRIQEDEDPTPISTPRPLLRPLQGRFDSSLSAASSAMGGMTSENASFYTASSGRTPGVLSPPFAATPSSLAGRELGYTSTPRAQNVIEVGTGQGRRPLRSSHEAGVGREFRSRRWKGEPVRDIKLSDIRKRVTVEEVKVKALDVGKGTLKSIPAVLLGCLLNVLDGVSYGMILFPNTPPFTNLGPMGVSMFFVSAIIAQFVYSAGGSGFAGGNGSMMIEVVPFFHILAADIASQIGEDNVKEVIATTLVAYAFSSILTGITFFLLGALKLGVLVGFFPRHILVGCIGGVGVFLIITGFAVSMRLSEDDLSFSLETFRIMFMQTHNLVLWTVPLALAALLRVITAKIRHQLVFPAYFIIIPAIFYVVVLAARLDLTQLRENGWLFDIGADGGREPWWKFYTYYDFRSVHFTALWNTLPTQFALLFFNILHPPLNVPALAVSLDMDVDTNKELVGHGYSNLVSGLFGTVPNYLVYVNTLLFYRVGGETRLASFLLMLATVGLLLIGTGPIAYLPVLVVGALIFVLGIDLVKEALWDTRHRVSRSEYVTILSIMVCMTVWDFVIGVLFGIVVSCFFFVVQNSHRRSIRAVFTGDTAMSAVRRPSVQRAYVREVAKQTTVLRLQGFLFFGTITYVEEAIRDLISGPAYTQNPVRFLVLDFTLVAGVDMSSAEALVRVQRLLSSKCVTLVICGVVADSPVSKSLDSVGLLGAEYVELFRTFNDGMEWTENEYLRAWYRSQKMEVSGIGATAMPVPSRREPQIEFHHPMSGSLVMSPRRTHIRDTGDRTIATEIIARQEEPHYSAEPLNTLTKAFSSYGEVEPRLFAPISDYFNRIIVPAGHVLWRQNDPSDGLYVVESGVLRASYDLTSRPSRGNRRLNTFDESMVAGTVAGELSALSDSPRNATVVVEQPAVLWRLSTRNLDKMQVEKPELARVFVRLVLKAAKVDYDILLTAIAARQ